jgi:hypothetical protein
MVILMMPSEARPGTACVNDPCDAGVDWQQPWARHALDYKPRKGADGIRIRDVNGDGYWDATVAYEQSDQSHAYINPGPEAVKKPWPTVKVGVAVNVEDAFFADLDGNGIFDVVSCTEDEKRKILIHWAPDDPDDYFDKSSWGKLTIPAPAKLWMYGVPFDVNGDGAMDLIVGARDRGAKIAWLEAPAPGGNPRDGSQWTYHEIGDVGHTMSIKMIDMNGDAESDIVLSDRRLELMGFRWLENPGPGAYHQKWKKHIIVEARSATFFGIGDIDLDTDIDFVFASGSRFDGGRIYLAWFEREANTPELVVHEIDLPLEQMEGFIKAVGVGDIDRDGKADIVLSLTDNNENSPGVLWLKQPSDPKDSDWGDLMPIADKLGSKFDDVVIIDLDEDGDLDVMTTEEKGAAPGNDQGLGAIWYENPLSADLSRSARDRT